MPKRTEYSASQQQAMARRYLGGETCQSIARGLGVDFAIAKRVLTEQGVYEPGRKFQGRYTIAQKQEMATAYEAGESLQSLGLRFGCHRLNVRHLLVRRGVEIRNSRVFPLSDSDAELIRARRADGLPFAAIANEIGVPPHRVLKWARELGISDFKGKSGPESHAWKGGRTQHNGYALVRLSSDDPLYSMATTNGYAAEHRVVMARSIGRLLTTSETVHHLNGDRLDNRLENLQLRQGRHGKGARFVCKDCGSSNVEAAPLT